MNHGNDISRRAFLCASAAIPFAARAVKVRPARHVVVIGAGAFGGWTALALLRAGLQVTLVDAWGPGNARASSGGETRVIRAIYGGVATYTTMVARALELWRAAEREWHRQVFFPSGALWLFASDDAYVRRSVAPMNAAGLPIDELSPAQAARRFPQMNFSDARSIFFEPNAGFISARVACELVRDTFVRAGGVYHHAWVQPVTSEASRLTTIRLSDGAAIEADQFVFACGPWMSRVFPQVVGTRIRSTRQEVFFFGTPAGDARYDVGSTPVWVHMGERVTYGVPNHERRGLKIADDTLGADVDPDTLQRVPSEEGATAARAIMTQRFPELATAPLLEARVCQYEVSSDGNFLIDRHPYLENVWLLGGGSGHGFKMGPALGEYVAAVIRGIRTVDPLFAYSRLNAIR